MPFTPDELVKDLAGKAGNNLKSVVLYGSAAAGDHVGKKSDFNVLVVLEKLGVEDLTALSKTSARWVKAGNPPPLLFTWDRLRKSTDVFPIELADLLDCRKVLHGEDPLAGLAIEPAHLRFELEHELKGKLIQLREQFLVTEGKPSPIKDLMIGSLSTFLVLFRAALRLHGKGTPPAKKLEALAELRKQVEFDDQVFHEVGSLKEGKKGNTDPLALFSRYLKAVETVTDAVDAWTHS